MEKRPVIGITPGFDNEKEKSCVRDGYYEAVYEAGGLPVIIPLLTSGLALDNYLDICSGILITGGPDVDAVHYGEVNLPVNGEISPARDEQELYLARNAVRLKKPVLCICRGIQLLNVAFGGSLYQDIAAQVQNSETLKHSQEAPVWYPTHEINIKKGSGVWNSFGAAAARVNSFHHQAVKHIADGFEATSHSPDGIIESIEYQGDSFALGVQWHPELMWKKNRQYLGVFRLFIEACR